MVLEMIKRNKEFIVAGIQNLMVTNYDVSPSCLDIEHLVDSSLSFTENWNIIKPQVLQLCDKENKILWS